MNARPVHLFLLALKSPTQQAYEFAIDACADEKFIHLEAMARERFSIYLEGRGDHALAKTHLEYSYWLFQDWSAHAKAAEMSRQYTWLKVSESSRNMTFESLVRLRSHIHTEHVTRQGKIVYNKSHSVNNFQGLHYRIEEKECCVRCKHNTRYQASCVCQEQETNTSLGFPFTRERALFFPSQTPDTFQVPPRWRKKAVAPKREHIEAAGSTMCIDGSLRSKEATCQPYGSDGA